MAKRDLQRYDVLMSLKKAKPRPTKRKGLRITSMVSRTLFYRPKDPCYGPLKKDSQVRATDAHSKSILFLLDGKLQCECGKMVSATLDSTTGSFLVHPRPHERYKGPHLPPRKRDYGKRT